MSRSLKAALILVLAGALFACSSSSSSEDTKTTAARLCAEKCERVAGCDPALPTASCEAPCLEEQTKLFPRLREDVVEGLRQCIGARECPRVLAHNFVDACIEEAAAGHPPSGVAHAFCEAWSTWARACGAEIDPPSCIRGSKRFRDEALVNGKTCFAKACDQAMACLKESLGDLSPFEERVEAPPFDIPSSGLPSTGTPDCKPSYICSIERDHCKCLNGPVNQSCCHPGYDCSTPGAPSCDALCRSC